MRILTDTDFGGSRILTDADFADCGFLRIRISRTADCRGCGFRGPRIVADADFTDSGFSRMRISVNIRIRNPLSAILRGKAIYIYILDDI